MIDLNQSRAKVSSLIAEKLGNKPFYTSAELHGLQPSLLAWAKKNLTKKDRGQWVSGAPKGNKSVAVSAVADVDVGKQIQERFAVLSLLADGVASKSVRSLIVAGAPGVGKTYTLEDRLEKAKAAGVVKNLTAVRGSISAIGLYIALWENRAAGNVLLLDDIDRIFDDEEAMNLLKGALDTTKKRNISWIKASSILKDNDIPNNFEYEGQVVFITNKNIDDIISKGGKMAPHMSALVSRSVFLDLCIHDVDQIIVRIEQVLKTTDMADDLGITAKQIDAIVSWMKAHSSQLRSVSLRTVIQLASFVKTTENWEMLARTTMLRAL